MCNTLVFKKCSCPTHGSSQPDAYRFCYSGIRKYSKFMVCKRDVAVFMRHPGTEVYIPQVLLCQVDIERALEYLKIDLTPAHK